MDPLSVDEILNVLKTLRMKGWYDICAITIVKIGHNVFLNIRWMVGYILKEWHVTGSVLISEGERSICNNYI